MALKIASIKNQESLGVTAGTITNDFRLNYNVHSMHVDVFSYKDSATAATIQNLVGGKLTTIKVSTQSANPETTIRTDDLYDFQKLALNKNSYTSILTSTDNIPHAFGIQLPFSPFPDDPTRNFGLNANQGVQISYETAADVSQDFDNYLVDTTVEGLDTADKPQSLGHVSIKQDAFTSGAVDSVHDTVLGVSQRLLGIFNFMTTSYDDLAASTQIDVVGIRSQAIAFSESIAASWKSSRSWSMKNTQTVASFAAAAATINVLDDGRWFNDFGLQNDNANLGLNISGIGVNTKVKTTAGVASEATRVMPILLL